MIGVEFVPENIAQTIKTIKRLEPEAVKKLQRDIKSQLSSVMAAIQSGVPSDAPLSGMKASGRLRWTKPKVALSFRPSNKFKGNHYAALVSIAIYGAAFKMAELAGARGKSGQWRKRTPGFRTSNDKAYVKGIGITTQGEHMIEVLKQRYPFSGKAGRFAFKSYLKVKDTKATEAVIRVLNDFAKEYTKKFGG